MKRTLSFVVLCLSLHASASNSNQVSTIGSWKYKGITCSQGEPSPEYSTDRTTYIINHKPGRSYDSVFVVDSKWVVTRGSYQAQAGQLCYRIDQASNNSGEPVYLGDSCSYATFTETSMTWRYISRNIKSGCEAGSEVVVSFEKMQSHEESDRP